MTVTSFIQRLEFHGDKGEPGYEILHPKTRPRRKAFKPGDDLSLSEDSMTAAYGEWVDIDKILPFRDHTGNQHDGSEVVVKRIQDDLTSGEGMEESLILSYSPGQHKAWLGEGNHRLEAARRAGWKQVPVRMVSTNMNLGSYTPYKDVTNPAEPGSGPQKGKMSNKWPDYFKPSDLFRGVISLDDPTFRTALQTWKSDPFPLHTKAPDILNGSPTPEDALPSYISNRKEMAAILQAMHDWSDPQSEMLRGVRKSKKTLEELEAEFTPGKEFTLGPRGFTTLERTAFSFARVHPNLGAGLVFKLEAGAQGLPIENLSSGNSDYVDDDDIEAERIVAGTFRVVSVSRQSKFYNQSTRWHVVVTIRQIATIKPPKGGFK